MRTIPNSGLQHGSNTHQQVSSFLHTFEQVVCQAVSLGVSVRRMLVFAVDRVGELAFSSGRPSGQCAIQHTARPSTAQLAGGRLTVLPAWRSFPMLPKKATLPAKK
jgi:hypothetical protein